MSHCKTDKIQDAYQASKNIYDDVLTQGNIFARAYIKFFWGGTDDVALAQKMLSLVPNDFRGTLLDVPCGTAVFTSEKWRSLTNSKIICLDYSNDMLHKAQQRLAEVEHVALMQGDVGALPFDSNSVDIVVSMNGFHAFPDKLRAFDETFRVLKSGGRFIASFYVSGKLRRADWLVNHILSRKGWFTPPFQTEDDVRAILTQRYSKVDIHIDNAMLWCVCEK